MSWFKPKPEEPFTPSTEDVRRMWTSFGLEGPSFDRWVVAHDAQVRQEAVDAILALNAEETPRLEQ